MVSRAFKKMINTLDHGSTKAKKVKTIGTYVERKGEQKDMELTIGIPVYKSKRSIGGTLVDLPIFLDN